jgi:hypothetical protein
MVRRLSDKLAWVEGALTDPTSSGFRLSCSVYQGQRNHVARPITKIEAVYLTAKPRKDADPQSNFSPEPLSGTAPSGATRGLYSPVCFQFFLTPPTKNGNWEATGQYSPRFVPLKGLGENFGRLGVRIFCRFGCK